jgi:hypothetical protein
MRPAESVSTPTSPRTHKARPEIWLGEKSAARSKLTAETALAFIADLKARARTVVEASSVNGPV